MPGLHPKEILSPVTPELSSRYECSYQYWDQDVKVNCGITSFDYREVGTSYIRGEIGGDHFTPEAIRDGTGCWEDASASTHKSLPELCSPDFSKLRALSLSAWYPLCCLTPCVGFAGRITGGCAGGFLSAALRPLRGTAQQPRAPRRCSVDCRPRIRKDGPETAQSWAAKCHPPSVFVLSLLKCCSQHEGPDMRGRISWLQLKRALEARKSVLTEKPQKTEQGLWFCFDNGQWLTCFCVTRTEFPEP